MNIFNIKVPKIYHLAEVDIIVGDMYIITNIYPPLEAKDTCHTSWEISDIISISPFKSLATGKNHFYNIFKDSYRNPKNMTGFYGVKYGVI
jgi:hypothetical protein